MAFSNDEKQEIKDIVLETMTEQCDAIDYTEQVVEFATGDEVPIVRNGNGTGEKSYGRAPVSMFGGGGSSGVNGIKVGGSGQVLTPTSGVVTLPAYEDGAEKNPVKYLKEAAISQDGNSLTIKDNNNETKTFTPNGGGGSSVTPSDADPLEDGTKSAGSSASYSRGDHRHPHDTTKADKSEMAITPGTGANSDKTTIQLKNGLSTTVLTQHQDVKAALGTGSGTTRYLREDGTWQTPPSGGGGGVSVDDALSTTSENPVQNKVITTELNKKQATLVNQQNIASINGRSLLNGGNIQIEGGDSGRLVVRNGSYYNIYNQECVATPFVATGASRYANVVTTRPNRTNCVYVYGYTTINSINDIGRNTVRTDEPSSYTLIDYGRRFRNSVIDMSRFPDAVGAGFVIAEFNTVTDVYEALRESDFNDYEVRITTSDDISHTIDNLVNGESVVKCELRNGSTGNPGNTNAVATFLVPTLSFSTFELKTTRPNREGYHYRYTVDFSTSPYGDNGAGGYSEPRTEHTDTQHNIGKFVRTYSESRGVQFAIWEVNEAESAYNPIRKSDFDGYEVYIIRSGVFDSNSIITANQDKLPMLTEACGYRKNNNRSKDFQMMIVTDAHDDNIVLRRAVTATNGVNTIDAIINCGDIVDYIDTYYEQNNLDLWGVPAKKCNKPFYCVIGNHDAGEYQPVYINIPDNYLYRYFIKPSVDAGHLLSGEYTENKCYYYHDFKNYNTRLIVLYEFEAPLIYDTTYWTPITYSSSLPSVKWNTSYNTGDEVRDFYRTDVGFRATQNFTTPYEGDFRKSVSNGNTLPCLKYPKGRRWISQTQAQWFLDTMLSTPAGYKIIVACHHPISDNAGVMQTSRFSQKNAYVDRYPYLPTLMANDFIANAIHAFQEGVNYSETCSSTASEIQSYTVSADFRNKNAGVKFHSMVGGHTHKDFVWKHNTYNIYDVTPICANTDYPPQCPDADIRRSSSVQSDGKDVDCLTVVTYKEDSMCLTKIGVDFTESSEKRDFETINIDNGKVSGLDNIKGFKVGDNGEVISANKYGIVQISSNDIKSALGVQESGTRYLKEDGTWQTPPEWGGSAPETQVIVVDIPTASQSNIAAYLLQNVPAAQRANNIFRVPGPSNTSFSEWAWEGSAFIMLDEKDYGVDDEPVMNSNNISKSGGISKWVGNVNIREITITQKEILLAQNVKKGTPIYINLIENPNSRNIGLFTGTRYDGRDIIYIPTIGEEVVFETLEYYENIYIVSYESSDFGDAKIAIGMNCVPYAILSNRRHVQSSNIVAGEEGQVYGSEYTASFRKLDYSGILKSENSNSKVSIKIPVSGFKYLHYKNLRNTADSTFGLFIYGSSDNILLRFSVNDEQNEGTIFLDQDYPSAAYVIFSPTKNQSLIDDSYIYLSSNETRLSSIKDKSNGITRTASTSKGLLRYSSLFGDSENIRVYTEDDCAFKQLLLKRDGVNCYNVPASLSAVTSDYIDITGYSYVYYYSIFPNVASDYTGLHLYDSSKNHLAVIGEEGGTVPISGIVRISDYSGAKYVRFSPYNMDHSGMIVLTKTANFVQPLDLLMYASVDNTVSADRPVFVELMESNSEKSIVLKSSDNQWWNFGNANNGVLQTYINNRPEISFAVPNGLQDGYFGLYFVYDPVANTASYEVGEWIYTKKDLSKATKKYIPVVTFSEGGRLCYRANNIVLGTKDTYILDANGNGDITSIDETVNLPINSVVRVMPGRYKTSRASFMNKGVTFIGDDVEKCIVYNDENDYYSAIYFHNGCCRNMTFISEACPDSTFEIPAYAVHIDHEEVVEGVAFGVRFENCRFISYNAQSLGIGMRKNFVLSFIGCEFIQKGLSTPETGAFSLHNCVVNAPVELQGSGTVVLSGCRLINEVGNVALMFALKTNSGVAGGIMDQYPTRWIIQNTSFYSRISGKNCIYANTPEGVYLEINAIPGAANLDPQSYNNNINILNS